MDKKTDDKRYVTFAVSQQLYDDFKITCYRKKTKINHELAKLMIEYVEKNKAEIKDV
jgi:hypothetical protein